MAAKARRRIVVVRMEMELIDGAHFNHNDLYLTDEEATELAVRSFIDVIRQIPDDQLGDYIQTKVIEEDT